MRSPWRSLLRLAISVAVGGVVGLITQVLIPSFIWPWTQTYLVLALIAASAGGLGAEIGLRRTSVLRAREAIQWIVGVFAAGALLGIGVVTLANRHTEFPSSVWLIPALLGTGVPLLAGLIAGRHGGWRAWLDGLLAPVTILSACLGAALGGAVVFAQTFPQCPQIAYCLEPPALTNALLLFTFVGLVIGLWLGLTLYLALGASGALRPRSADTATPTATT
jgi:hypothetical protein